MELGVPEEDEEEPQPGTSAGGGRNLGLFALHSVLQ